MRYLQHVCTHCKEIDRVEAALAVVCPTCATPAGSPCVDQRGAHYRELTNSHLARRRLVDETCAGVRRQLATAS